MKLTQFRKLIREEIRRVVKEGSINTLELGNGRVVKNVSVDANGIKFNNKTIPMDSVHDYFSTKKGKEQQLAKLVMDSELLQRVIIEAELGISDEEGVADALTMEDAKLVNQIKTLTDFGWF
jgi:hypothetical protein